MRLSTAHDGPVAVVRMTGRLDGESARHLSDTVEDLLRDGVRSIDLDMAGVEYLSSAGTRVLAARAADLTALRGSLHVVAPSDAARAALAAADLADLIRAQGMPRVSGGSSRFTHWGFPAVGAQHGTYEVSRYESKGVRVLLYGPGRAPVAEPIDPAQCRVVDLPERSFALGIGAIADRYEEAAPRLGELIAAEGIAAYLPTDGERIPDFMLTHGDRFPRAVLATGISWTGLFSDLMRFSTQPDSDEVPLSELAKVCLAMTDEAAVAIACVAEMSGLVGASLRRSPGLASADLAGAAEAARLREWISFTPEPAHLGSTALILGIIAREPAAPLAGHLRPLDGTGEIQGHLHAAVFPYIPVPQRTVLLPSLLSRLFEERTLRDVLHLLHDDRGAAGAGETGLLRGVCWMAPVGAVAAAA